MIENLTQVAVIGSGPFLTSDTTDVRR